MTQLFQPTDQTTEARLLAAHAPDGFAWQAKNVSGATMQKLFVGLAGEFFRLTVLIEDVATELDIEQTSDLILEWEESVGIPDSCFDASGGLEQRRENVLNKLTNFGGVQTAADFVRVAASLGYTATISNGTASGVFPLLFPIRFFSSKKEASHTIFVNLEEKRAVFPLDFPIEFTSDVGGIIECLFRKLAPANCQLIFSYGVT